jgi:hydroxymethylglutaryl-CoA lyase
MKTDEVVIREVMLRDGLQNIPEFIPTEAKIELFRLIAASGIRNMEITSFVSPKAIPQFRDAAEMARAVLKMNPQGVEVSALVPNLKGAQLALESGMHKVGFVMSVSESHNISNVRRTTAESMDELKKIVELKEKYPDLDVKAGMATASAAPSRGGSNRR